MFLLESPIFLEEASYPFYALQGGKISKEKYKDSFKKLLIKGNLPISYNELESFFSQWNSINEGSLAQMYSKEIESQIPDFANKLISSASFIGGINAGLNGEKKIGSEFTEDLTHSILKKIQDYLSDYASLVKSDALQKNVELLESMKAGKAIGDLEISKTGIKVFSAGDIDIMKKSSDGYLKKLGQIIEGLQNMTEKSVSVGDKIYLNPWELIKTIQGILNKLGGEKIAEPFAVGIGQLIAGQMSEKLTSDEIIKAISGGKVSATVKWDEGLTAAKNQGEMSGKQLKPDYHIEFNISKGSGQMTITLPVSMKIRQSAGFKSAIGKDRGAVAFQSMELRTALKLLESDNAMKDLESGWYAIFHNERSKNGQLVPTKYDEYKEYEKTWHNMIRDTKIRVAEKAVLGDLGVYKMTNGTSVTNMIAVVQINDRFVSAYEIVSKLDDPESLNWDKYSGAIDTKAWRKYAPLGPAQKSGLKTGKLNKNEILSYVQKEIDNLYARKVAVNISLAKLIGM